MMAAVDAVGVLADLHALLEHVGERGVPLTDTGRLRLADVRAINARFAEPAELDHEFGSHTYRVRSEDEAWRVHFLRLAAQAAGLLDARRGRLRRTARVRAFERLAVDDAARELFVAWWWKAAWDLLAPPGAPQLALMRDREATARALLDLGTETRTLETLGERLRRSVAPRVPASTSPLLSDEAWAYAAWHVCFEPLAEFGGSRATRSVEEINGHAFEHLAAVGLTEDGQSLLRAALDARPAAPPRVRRGMRTSVPPPRPSDVDDDALAWMIEGELRERVMREHPEYRDAIARRVEQVGGVNPRAHIALHEGIESQLAAKEPREVRETYERLIALGYDRHEVQHALADALAREVWAAERDHRPFDNVRYIARLAALPLDHEVKGEDEEEAPELPPAKLAAEKRRRLLALPRSTRVWEGDLTEMPIDVAEQGSPLCAIWADAGDGTVRTLLPRFDTAPGALALAAFVDAALRPQAGRAELPARVRVHPELATALRPALAEVGVGLEAAEELRFAHDALDSLAGFLREPPARHTRGRRHRRS